MKWTQYRQRLLSHGTIYDVYDETPKYWFQRNEHDSYKDDVEYETWENLFQQQDKRDKKLMSKLRNKRLD